MLSNAMLQKYSVLFYDLKRQHHIASLEKIYNGIQLHDFICTGLKFSLGQWDRGVFVIVEPFIRKYKSKEHLDAELSQENLP